VTCNNYSWWEVGGDNPSQREQESRGVHLLPSSPQCPIDGDRYLTINKDPNTQQTWREAIVHWEISGSSRATRFNIRRAGPRRVGNGSNVWLTVTYLGINIKSSYNPPPITLCPFFAVLGSNAPSFDTPAGKYVLTRS